jgi:hypothetical protein
MKFGMSLSSVRFVYPHETESTGWKGRADQMREQILRLAEAMREG